MTKGRPEIKSAVECFTKALEILNGGRGGATLSSSTTVPVSGSPTVAGFDENVNRNLVIPSPPRAAVVRSAVMARCIISPLLSSSHPFA